MLVALGRSKIPQSFRQAAKQSEIDTNRIWRASFVIENAPDQVDLVLAGLPLEKAYAVGSRSKLKLRWTVMFAPTPPQLLLVAQSVIKDRGILD
jgi:hypothetical protein